MAIDCIGLEFPVYVEPKEDLPEVGTLVSDHVERIVLGKTHILHVLQPMDTQCVEICVERVVKCLQGCEDEEFKWVFPLGCEYHVLPPGTYDVSIPEQDSYPLNDGEFIVNMLLEPVEEPLLRALELNCH